jgi:hypothetical protein
VQLVALLHVLAKVRRGNFSARPGHWDFQNPTQTPKITTGTPKTPAEFPLPAQTRVAAPPAPGR